MVLGQHFSRVYLYLEGQSFGLWVGWPPSEPLVPAREDWISQAPNDPFDSAEVPYH